MKRILWIVFAVLAVGVGVYPAMYLLTDMSGGLLSSKSRELIEQFAWNLAFYSHIATGGIALLTGWSQFITSLKRRYVKLHRRLGTIYVAACLSSGVAAFYLAIYASTGVVASLGFGALAVSWITSTLLAYTAARQKMFSSHGAWMTRSFALTFAAVMLRIYLPLAEVAGISFDTSYPVISYLCWVPNLLAAEFFSRRRRVRRARLSGDLALLPGK